MPYCPTCKKEYPSGTTICAECNISLVNTRPADLVSFVSLQNQEVSDRFIEYLKEHEIQAISEYGIRDDVYRIYVNKDDKKTAMKCFISFQAAEKRSKNGSGSGDNSAASVQKEIEEAQKAKKKAEEERRAEEERIAAEKKADEERIAAAMKAEEERRAEEARIAAEKKAEEERIAAEKKAEEERIAAEKKAEEERIAREKAEAERIAAEKKAEEERIAREKAEAERIAAEKKAEEERIAREKEEAERIAREKAEAERIAREKEEAERIAAEKKAEEERIAREKAEAERIAAEKKAEEERIAREKAEAERIAAEKKAEEERIAREKKAEEERIAREKAEAERIAREKKAEEERIAREKAEAERIAAEKKAEEERIAREKAEAERIAAEKKAEEERRAAAAKQAEEHETEFTANAATRTKRPYYPKNESSSPENDSEFESIFAAKKDNKKRSTLFAEMEKNEEAAASAAEEGNAEDGFDFTPKRPLTAYQFEKKRQEDLDTYVREHENTETPATSGRASVIEEDGKVNISFSDYEQTYEVPNYEDADPTPVYSDPNVKVDWGAGADDSATDWQNRSSESEPIFVETERVNSDDIDDDKIIDEADIRSFSRAAEDAESAYESPVNSAQDPTDYESSSEADAEGSEDAFSDFLNNFKRASLSKSMKKSSDTGERSGKGTYASSRPTPVAVPEQVKPATKKPVVSEASDAAKSSKQVRSAAEDIAASKIETVVEDIVPDAKYRTQDDTDYESVPSRPTDIQDTKIKVSFDNDIIEEVVTSAAEEVRPNIDQSSSFANPEKPVDAAFSSKKPTPRKFEAPEELDDGTYRGFVPDYSPTNPDNESAEPEEVSEYDEFKKKVHARKEENQAINAQIKAEATRQANLVKDFGKKGKIVFEDTDDLDNYAGFVPDYTPNTSNEEEFDFYKPHQVSSYAKYKKGSKPGAAEGAPGRTTGFMRLTSDDEVETLFITHVPSTAKKVLKPQEIKNANFLINMSGKRLSKLFNSWMMLNVTTQTVRAFEKDDAEDAENYELKINGIKKLLTDNFGEINEIFLDSLVQRYYSKFLDE